MKINVTFIDDEDSVLVRRVPSIWRTYIKDAEAKYHSMDELEIDDDSNEWSAKDYMNERDYEHEED